MTGIYKFNLLDNAFSSFEEALIKYRDGQKIDKKYFKFCITHLSHFVELYLKHCVSTLHPLLLYVHPYKPTKGANTITLSQAMQILKNAGIEITKEFEDDIKWLKDLRNNIEHYEFEIVENKAEEYIGRIMSGILEFNSEHNHADILGFFHSIEDKIDIDWAYLTKLSMLYRLKLKRVEDTVRQAEEENYTVRNPGDPVEDKWYIIQCEKCLHHTMIPNKRSKTGWKCEFCGEEEPNPYEAESDCTICGMRWPLSELSRFTISDDDEPETACPYCRHDPAYFKDD